MKRFDYFYKRLLAYLIDLLLIEFIVTCLTGIRVINPQYNSYKKSYLKYATIYIEYEEEKNNDLKTCSDLEKAIKKEKLTNDDIVTSINKIKNSDNYEDECQKIVNNYNENKISEEEYNKSIRNLSKEIEKNKTFEYLITVLIALLYMVGFQKITEGQTLGKKILGLKVEPLNNKLTFKQLFISTIFLCEIIRSILLAIIPYIFNVTTFYNAYSIINLVNYMVLICIGLVAIVRSDNRGIHDIIAKTQVIDISKRKKNK